MVQLVRNTSTGRVLPCCWSDCERPGDNRIQHRENHDQPRWPGEKLVYIFCSERHRAFWRASHRLGAGRLPSGERGGLILPGSE